VRGWAAPHRVGSGRAAARGACEPEWPVEAIFPEDALPDKWEAFIRTNYAYGEGADVVNRLVDEYAAYQGQWRLGIRMDRLRSAVPLDLLQDPLRRLGNPYSRDEYEKVTSASTEELVNAPHAVAERLVAPLLRGLGIAPRYLPYKP